MTKETIVTILFAVFGILLPCSHTHATSINQTSIIELTNTFRREHKISALKENGELTHAAQTKADDMLAKQYFSHVSPDGASLDTWLSQVGYHYLYAGENLAVHYVSAEEVLQGWTTSVSHRATILNSHYADVGVGVATGNFEGVPTMFVVQYFGKGIPQHLRKLKTTMSDSLLIKKRSSSMGKQLIPIIHK